MSLCVLGCVCRAHGGQKRESDALELEGQRVGSYLTRTLRPESHLSRMTHVALRSSFLSSPCVHMFIQALCIVYSGHSSFRTNSAVSYFLVWPNGLRRTCTLWVHELDHNSFPAGDTLIITGTQIRLGKVSLHTHTESLWSYCKIDAALWSEEGWQTWGGLSPGCGHLWPAELHLWATVLVLLLCPSLLTSQAGAPEIQIAGEEFVLCFLVFFFFSLHVMTSCCLKSLLSSSSASRCKEDLTENFLFRSLMVGVGSCPAKNSLIGIDSPFCWCTIHDFILSECFCCGTGSSSCDLSWSVVTPCVVLYSC